MIDEFKTIEDEDYIEISSWLSLRSWPMPHGEKCLPDTGYVYKRDGRRKAAAWAYMTNSNVVIVSWICTPPDSKSEGLEDIKTLIEHIKTVVDPNSAIMFMVSSEKLSKYLGRACGTTRPKTTYNTYYSRR